MQLEILRINKLKEDSINYRNLVFKFRAVDVFDMDRSADMLITCRTLIKGGALKLLFDLEDLEFIDSSGIGALINIAKIARLNEGDIALVNVPAKIELIFKPVNLQRFISFHAGIEEAVNFFRLT